MVIFKVAWRAVVTSRRWTVASGPVCLGLVLLAACGHEAATLGSDPSAGRPAIGGGGADRGGTPGAVFGGGAAGDPELGEAAGGERAGAGATSGATGVDGGAAGVDGGAAGVDGAGAGAGAGGDGAAGAPSGSIELQDFGDYQVFQRVLGGHGQRVRIAGTYSGSSITSVQARVVSFTSGATVIVPWHELDATSEGAYSGTIEVPQGGWYRLVARGLDERDVEVATASGGHRWGVGMNILCIGQSNMVGYGGRSYTTAGELAGLYGNDRTWRHLADPYDSGGTSTDADYDSGAGASLVPSLVNAVSAYFPGLPIGVIPAARGSSPLACTGSDWCWGRRNPDDPADPSTLYGNSLAEARRAGGAELIVMHQGETDATNSTSRAAYASQLALLAQNYRTDLGDVPLFMCQLGRSTTEISVKNRTDASMQAIRAAQHDADDPPRIYLAATAVDLDVDGTDHYVKTTLDELGRRMAAAIAYHYGVSGAPPSYRGPEIAGASYADASRRVIDVQLRHRGGADFAPAASINGFVVLDGSAPVPLASVVRRNPTTIRITVKAAIAGAGSVRYLYGKLPFQTLSNTVHDDSSLTLPLEPTASDISLP